LDFIRIIRSLEELLYEAMTWIIFYPLTMLRILFNPTRMTLYSDVELGDALEQQYTDSLSPPLLLMLTIVLTHGIELAFGIKATSSLRTGSVLATFMADEQNLLIVRALVTAIVPLAIALIALKTQKRPLDRTSLRRPFYSQCFLVSPFAFAFSISTILARMPISAVQTAAPYLLFGGVIWFCWAETRWFARQHEVTFGRALLSGIGSVALALMTAFAVAAMLTLLL
jgi:hypothetical protein